MSRKNRSTIARSAVVTRQARRAFLDRYGCNTYDVVELLVKGRSSQDIEQLIGVPRGSVRAYAANLTRGTYRYFVDDCNF